MSKCEGQPSKFMKISHICDKKVSICAWVSHGMPLDDALTFSLQRRFIMCRLIMSRRRSKRINYLVYQGLCSIHYIWMI